jgi:putative DNA primase/helicase
MALKKVKRPILPCESRDAAQVNRLILPSKEESPQTEIMIHPFMIKGKELFEWNEKLQMYLPICDAVHITDIQRNIESKEVSLKIRFWAYDRWESITIKRGELTKKDIKKLASRGMDVLEDVKANKVFSFLCKQEKTLKPHNVHSGLGWDLFEGELIYKHHNIHSKKFPSDSSRYVGDFRIEPKGDLYTYKLLLVREVIGHVPLELILCMGISALVVGYLNRSGFDDFDSLLIHLSGKTTTGKTTAGMLAASVAGYPSVKKNGLIQTYNGTKNAMARIITGNYGIPIVFDETSMNTMGSENLSSFLYELAQNRERARMTKELELKEVKTWCTTIFSTGEESIIKRANNNEGLRVRLFEFSDVKWTKDAGHAERLKEGLLHNYGHLAPLIAIKMLQYGPGKIVEMVRENQQYILKKLPQSQVSSRIAMKFGVIFTAATLFEEVVGLELSGEKMLEMLIDQELSSLSERETAPKFYMQLKEHVIRNHHKFKIPSKQYIPHGETWGIIEFVRGSTYLYILPNVFREIAETFKYKNVSLLVNSLKDLRVLVHEPNKNQKRKLIFGKDELEARERMTGKSGFSNKGDYTYCIVYEGNIL